MEELKHCYKCKQSLPLSQFRTRKRAKRLTTLRDECKECEKQYRETKRQKKIEYLRQLKAESSCLYCKEATPCCLDFHHCGDDKLEGIAAMTYNNTPLAKLQAEIAKCKIVCSNCHRKIHAGLLPNVQTTVV